LKNIGHFNTAEPAIFCLLVSKQFSIDMPHILTHGQTGMPNIQAVSITKT
jgi:hypothetical protein